MNIAVRQRLLRAVIVMVMALLAGAACGPQATPSQEPSASSSVEATFPPVAPFPGFHLELQRTLQGLREPVFITHAGDGSGSLYVVEKAGVVRMAVNGALRPTPFLDITALVRSAESERGLLGLAFHPNYRVNRFFYVNYTDHNGNSVIARYTARSDGSVADPSTAKVILAYDQPFPNHNGGMLLFGPDGKLWIGTGDGGSAGDPRGNGQNRQALLGKMLRIDVDRGDPYGVPSDNPFVKDPDPSARAEVWAIGLRNPWRYSFDRATGDLYIADVGQNAWEEVDVVMAGSNGGLNFGWNRMEGAHCFAPRTNCDSTGLEIPVAEYSHERSNCSITGGYVYRGKAYPQMVGVYFYGDYCSGRIWGLKRRPDGSWANAELAASNLEITSFGEDEDGEVYLTAVNGNVYRLVAAGQ